MEKNINEKLSSLLPANSDGKDLPFDRSLTEIVGRRAGDEGITSSGNLGNCGSMVQEGIGSTSEVYDDAVLAPHPQTPSPQKFGQRLMKWRSGTVRIPEERGLTV